MAKQQSRVLRFVQPHAADLLVPGLIDGLNSDGQTQKFEYDRDMLVRLVRELQQLEEEWAKPKTRFQEHRTGLIPSKAVQDPWRNICSILNQYIAQPTLTLWGPDPGVEPLDAAWSLTWTRADGKPNLDLDLALDALEIFKSGRIRSLKGCDQCGNWFLARFPHQRFCSAECKDQFHTTNEADKARRRDWARANYQARKELELGSRKAAKRRGGKR